MKTLKKILIAVDYNPAAQSVAEAGYAIAKALQGTVVLLHVTEAPAYYKLSYSLMGMDGYPVIEPENNSAKVKEVAAQFLVNTARQLGDESLTTVVLDGEPENEIIAYANKMKADMIVMGSHKYSAIERLFFTDVAVNVMKHAKMPVLTIPTNG